MATTTAIALCSFRIDGHLYGVEVARVREVIQAPTVTAVPLAGPAVLGLINLRGQLVSALDMRVRLGLGEAPEGLVPMGLVVRDDRDPCVLIVDRVEEVLEVDEGAFEPTPDTLGGPARALIRGTYKLEGRLLHLFDIDEAARTAAVPQEPTA